MRWVDAQCVFIEAAGRCLMKSGSRAAFEGPVRDAWRKAYAEAGRPELLGPEEGQRFVAVWQRHLRSKMRSVCERATKPELFFAARLLQPFFLRGLEWPSSETNRPENLLITMAIRRTASDAALLFGRKPPRGYELPYGGGIRGPELERFGRAFLTLLALSEAHFFSWGRNAAFGLGLELAVSEEGFQPLRGGLEELRILTASRDERDHRYYSPFTRVGEFSTRARRVLDPHKGPSSGPSRAPSFVTGRYEPDAKGRPGYRFAEWDLGPLRDFFLEDLDAAVTTETLGVGPTGFLGLLGGLCSMADERLREADGLEAAHATGVIPFGTHELKGEDLLDRSGAYLKDLGVDPRDVDLEVAQERFLYLASSAGKGTKDPAFLQTTVGNTRYSYLLHRFGRNYALDLMHADHWLHRVMDLSASGTGRGRQASLKGGRVEDQIWDYFGDSPIIERVEVLKGYVVRRKKGRDDDDLDCPLRVGNTLVLAEVKGHRMNYETEAVDRRFVVERWENARAYLDKADATARTVAKRRDNDEGLREALAGVERILPVLCRPYPEWIPTTDHEFWLRPPAKGYRGVPRVPTPGELREFLESATEEEIAALPGSYVVDVRRPS